MGKPYSVPFRQKMVRRLTGKDAPSAGRLAEETGISQATLSRWVREARRLPVMPTQSKRTRIWTIEEKARLVAKAAGLTGEELGALLDSEGLTLARLEQWRMALDEEGRASTAARREIRKLERELARKEKALAEAAALLVLKKKVDQIWGVEDDDTDEGSEP
jgi:transposase